MTTNEKLISVITIAFLIFAIVASHINLDARLNILEQQRLEQIEKEKSVVGYWIWNPQYCQYFYEAKNE